MNPKSRLTRFLVLMLAFGLLGAMAHSAEYRSEDGWRSLFNGENLEGWEFRGSGKQAPTFKVEDKAILGSTLIPRNGTGFVGTTESFNDFELVFEMKVDKNLNLGMQIRSAPEGAVRGAQVEVENGSSESDYIFGQGMMQWLSTDLPRKPSDHFKDGDWNRFRVLVKEQNVKTGINDQPFADLTHELIAPEGVIALQIHAFPRGKHRDAGSDKSSPPRGGTCIFGSSSSSVQ